jgi:hypothetical protein
MSEGEFDLIDFDPEAVEPADDFELLPEGDYVVVILAAELKPTKDETGKRLALEIAVSEGDYAGRKMWPGLNVTNKNATAQKIGRQEYAALAAACGDPSARDPRSFVGKEVVAKVKISPARNGYEARNDVKKWLPLGGAAPSSPTREAPTDEAPRRAKPKFI